MMNSYDPDTFKVGMILLYMPGMREDLVGSINIIIGVGDEKVEVRRWDPFLKQHERGLFSLDIEKHKIKIIG